MTPAKPPRTDQRSTLPCATTVGFFTRSFPEGSRSSHLTNRWTFDRWQRIRASGDVDLPRTPETLGVRLFSDAAAEERPWEGRRFREAQTNEQPNDLSAYNR
jgi:hypothetical protein